MLHPILVCDDNVTQANKLTMAASHGAIITKEDNNGFELALTAYGYKQALDWVITNQPKAGIYFLDVELEGGTKKHTGLDLALKIKEVDQEAMIVFVTTHEEMAILTFERQIGPLDYITKSTNDEQFQQRVTNCMYTALQRYENEQATSGLKFRYRVGSREHIENFNNIICIETTSRPHVLEMITTTGIMQFPGTIKELAKAYPQFCKLSQSCLANLDNIKSADFKLRQVTFINNSVEPFSRRQTKAIKKALNIFRSLTLTKERKSLMQFLQTIITTLKNKLTATAAICILVFLLVVHPSFWDLLFTAIIMVPITLILNSKKEK